MNQKGFLGLIILIISGVFLLMISLVLYSVNLRYPLFEKCLQVDNTIPMYGNVKKCGAQKLSDDLFIINATNAKPFVESSRQRAADSLIRLAWEYSSSGQFDIAMRRLNQAWLLDPTNPSIFWGFGNVLAQKKNFSESFKMYDTALSLDPLSPEPKATIFCNYGLSYLQSGRQIDENADTLAQENEILDKASDLLQSGLQINPKNGQCHSLMAIIFYEQEKYQDAWKEIKIAEENGFENPQELIDKVSEKMPDPES